MERSASKVNEEREGATRALKGIVVVDLDGTLFLSDMLVENLFLFLRLYPLRIFEMIAWLFNGKAYFKRRLADAVVPDVSQLPYNKDLVAWLKNRRNEGASLILATATDMRIAKKSLSTSTSLMRCLAPKATISLPTTSVRRSCKGMGRRGTNMWATLLMI